VAARAFTATLLCDRDGVGCGECAGCHTVHTGTHGDLHQVVPEGLSIAVHEMRAIVVAAARRPVGGRWQVVLIEDADRLTEAAGNALLKAVEEPPERTIFLLCAPSDHPDDVPITIRSRCRVVPLHSPASDAIAAVLAGRDGIEPATAQWAASVCGGHVGRARHLATDADARAHRERILAMPLRLHGLGDAFAAAEELDRTAKAEAADLSGTRDAAEREELAVAMGAGGVGKGVAAAARAAKAAEKGLERRQRSRATRTQRDVLDLALIDLAGFFRDVLLAGCAAQVALTSPDRAGDVHRSAREWTPESVLRRLEAVLACREALDRNVKPLIALEAMLTVLQQG
jgi:DNA polymerase III subunit delta'